MVLFMSVISAAARMSHFDGHHTAIRDTPDMGAIRWLLLFEMHNHADGRCDSSFAKNSCRFQYAACFRLMQLTVD